MNQNLPTDSAMLDAPPAPPRSTPPAGPSRVMLALASALSPFAMVVIGPLLPAMARLYQTNAAETQFVISAYLFGLFVAQLILGPVSDRFGRKPVMLGGLAVYVLTSVACAYAPSLELLITARFVQACGAAALATAVRASVHDVYHGDVAARQMAVIAIGHSVAHTASPMIGGLLDGVLDVRGLFLLLAGLGLAMAVWTGSAMHETRRLVAPAGRFGIAHALQTSVLVVRSPVFLAYSGIYGLVGAG
ncbi:MAG: MFS transporter, partial [Rhodobacteraceae bacterium]|nr:MFS transporter [Paracoccaceae bacterium]